MKDEEYSLPPTWQWVKLRDVCEQDRQVVEPSSERASDLPYLSLEHIESNTGRILRMPSEIVENEGKSITFAFDHRHILYGKLRPYLNKVVMPEYAGRCTTELIPLLPKRVHREYLAWVLRRRETVDAAMREKTGSRMPRANMDELMSLEIPLPPLTEQQRIAAILNEKMAAIKRARLAIEEQLELVSSLILAYLRQSLSHKPLKNLVLEDCLVEVKQGIGETWNHYPVVGATRAGIAPAKEKVGKQPERYKPVTAGTIFYNPMRINIGSIAMIDEGESPGITSPDYVVLNTCTEVLHPRWFYYWLRSAYGEAFIKTLARGAVRERMLFNRLAKGHIEAPSWEVQCIYAEKLRQTNFLKLQLEKQLEVVNLLPPAILRKAFNGEL